MEIIARIYTDFAEKFGIPRQSGLVRELTGKIVFEPKYRCADAVKGLHVYGAKVVDKAQIACLKATFA